MADHTERVWKREREVLDLSTGTSSLTEETEISATIWIASLCCFRHSRSLYEIDTILKLSIKNKKINK